MQGRLISHTLLRTATMEHRNRRGERLDPQTTTLLGTLLPRTTIPRSLFIIPGLTLTCSHRQDGCTNGKIHSFTICYFSNGSRQQHGRVKLGKTTMLSCLECKVWMSCHRRVSDGDPNGGLRISTALIFYYYDYGIVCTIISITMVLYAQLLLWHCLYAKLWCYSFGEVL
jgi:hypothetical protein